MDIGLKINTIYNTNCLKGFSKLNDNSIDLILTSPPYNMNLRIAKGKYCSRQITKEFSTKYNGFHDNIPIEEYYEFHKKIIEEMLRVSKITFYNIQFLTGNKQAFFKLIGHFHDKIKEFIVWDKEVAQPAMQKNVLNSQFEVILVFDNENAISRMFRENSFDRGTLSNLWKIKRGKKISKEHGAVFPEELARKVILNFSKENEIILDPFLGTGTSGKVAFENNRKFIGFEQSNEYSKISKDRISQINKIEIINLI